MTSGRERAAPHAHVVNFYDHDREIVTDVAKFVADGLAHGDRVILIATAAHRTAVDDVLLQFGTDAARARVAGRLLTLDAAETLDSFMVDDAPDADAFREHVGSLIDAAGEDGCPIRAFGEMVALLWEQGNVAGAIELEELWNRLADTRRFSLLCAYPVTILSAGALAQANEVCSLHSDIVAPRSYVGGSYVGASYVGAEPGQPHRHVDGTSKMFVPVASAVPAARRFIVGVLRSWGEDAILADAATIVTELATNAVAHAASAFELQIVRTDGTVRISVDDVGPELPQPRHASPDAFGGRGMRIVEALTANWGCAAESDGKRVWAELPSCQARSESALPQSR